MKKKLVLFIADENFTISGLLNRIEAFTISNGGYPDFIEMAEQQIERYQYLLIYPSDKDSLTFHGIKIRQIK